MRHSYFAALIASALCLSAGAVLAKEPVAAEPKPAKVLAEKAADKPAAKASVNINTATAAELSEVLEGVGPAKADAIVAYRKEKGLFKSIDDLKAVKGIGDATVEKNRERILIK